MAGMREDLMSSLLDNKEILTFLISMLPISELRGAIPFAISQGIIPWEAYLIAVAGNILPVLPLLLLLQRLAIFAQRYKVGAKFLGWTVKRAKKREDLVKRYGWAGLILLVAIPLPITGAWTGTLVSFLLSMRIKYAFLAICIGVGIAGIIVLLASMGVFFLFVGM